MMASFPNALTHNLFQISLGYTSLLLPTRNIFRGPGARSDVNQNRSVYNADRWGRIR
jgi:hypothetical protein